MNKKREKRKRVYPPEKYLLCQIPPEWTTLPVHTGLESGPPPDSVAVYTKHGPSKKLVYEGYICPSAPENVPMTVLQPPPWPQKEENFGKKYARLLERIRAEEAETKASSQPEQGVVKAVSSTTPSHTADVSAQQTNAKAAATTESKNKTNTSKEQTESLNLPLQKTKSNSDYPLPLEILDRRESFLPAPTEEGKEESTYYFVPWESMNIDLLDCDKLDSSLQHFSSARSETRS
ncbi:uncharacterized protein LOC122995796 [Thunnus albacares]|uniref:uncharacterized protein LOC122995796 n=1 Tax=Thunnus albacares TaxID=8236 RepID=UPI001CF68E5A|nr:uncharacterized protein LOC122995796 [Thunnus albacares]